MKLKYLVAAMTLACVTTTIFAATEQKSATFSIHKSPAAGTAGGGTLKEDAPIDCSGTVFYRVDDLTGEIILVSYELTNSGSEKDFCLANITEADIKGKIVP